MRAQFVRHCVRCFIEPKFSRLVRHGEAHFCEHCVGDIKHMRLSLDEYIDMRARRETVQCALARLGRPCRPPFYAEDTC